VKILILGMIVFLGMHSIRIFADGWRSTAIERLGAGPWKGIYSVTSVAGFVLIVWGFSQAREHPASVWSPPFGLNYAGAALNLLAFILFVAAYVPRNSIKAGVHHPMVLSVIVWAIAHLMDNGNLADIVLFGGFLAWAVASIISARRRDRIAVTIYAAGNMAGTLATIAIGLAAYAVFVLWLHRIVVGVSPLSQLCSGC